MSPLQTMILTSSFIVGIPLFWCGLIWFIGMLTGWQKLSRVYPKNQPIAGEKFFCMRSMRIGRMGGYNNALTIGISDQGMSLAMPLPFRMGHPPIFIPWEDMIAEKVTYLKWISMIQLTLLKLPDIHLHFEQKLADKLQEASKGYWPKVQDTES